jgi:hypothetical protein
MIFRAIATTSFHAHFNVYLLIGTLAPVGIMFIIVLGACRLFRVRRSHCGTFMQNSFHGNLGYIGLAVAYYFLGTEGFTRTGILAGFLMLMQNFFSILGLQIFSKKPDSGYGPWFFVKKIIGNPVIVSAIGGILFSVFELPLPQPVDRTLNIISCMALPLALLTIGASLSLKLIQSHLKPVLSICLLKLFGLPLIGLLTYQWFGMKPELFLPGLILLATPSATVSYVMARELDGSPDLASSAISLTTLISSITFTLWLGYFS